jgi:hypothetical protein
VRSTRHQPERWFQVNLVTPAPCLDGPARPGHAARGCLSARAHRGARLSGLTPPPASSVDVAHQDVDQDNDAGRPPQARHARHRRPRRPRDRPRRPPRVDSVPAADAWHGSGSKRRRVTREYSRHMTDVPGSRRCRGGRPSRHGRASLLGAVPDATEQSLRAEHRAARHAPARGAPWRPSRPFGRLGLERSAGLGRLRVAVLCAPRTSCS